MSEGSDSRLRRVLAIIRLRAVLIQDKHVTTHGLENIVGNIEVKIDGGTSGIWFPSIIGYTGLRICGKPIPRLPRHNPFLPVRDNDDRGRVGEGFCVCNLGRRR